MKKILCALIILINFPWENVMKKTGFFFLILLISATCEAATVYVKDTGSGVYYQSGASSCDDVDTGDTAGTLQTAATAAGASGTLNICPGTYSGTDVVSPVGSLSLSSASITVKGSTGNRGDVIINGSGLGNHTVDISGAGATLKDLTIRYSDSTKYCLAVSQSITVEDVDMFNCARGIYLNGSGGGTFNRIRLRESTDTSYAVAAAATNPSTWNYSSFEHNAGPIAVLAATTMTFNNVNFTGFKDLAFINSTHLATMTFNNCIFAANNDEGLNTTVVKTGSSSGAGTWTFNNSILGNTISTDSFLTNPSSTATVTYSNCETTSLDPKWKQNKAQGRLTLMIDDTENLADWYDLADLANGTYNVPVSIAIYKYGSGSVNWSTLASYISAGNEVVLHGWSGTRVWTSAGDDAAGTVNAFTAQKGSATITVSVTRPSATDSSTWTGTLQITGQGAIDLTSASYDSIDEIVSYLGGQGVTLGNATGQITYNYSSHTTKSLALKTGTYNINTTQTLVYDQTSLFVVEMKDAKAWLESNISPYIPGWTAKSFVYSGGYHGTNAETFAINTAGLLQARAILRNGTTKNRVTDLVSDSARLGGLQGTAILGTTDGNIQRRLGEILNSIAEFGLVQVVWEHAYSGFSRNNWISVLNTIRSSTRGVVVDTLGDSMDWARGVSLSTNNSNYQLMDSSPGISTGTFVTGLHDQATPVNDANEEVVHFTPNMGAYDGRTRATLTANTTYTGYSLRGTDAQPATLLVNAKDITVTLSGLTYDEAVNIKLNKEAVILTDNTKHSVIPVSSPSLWPALR